jgi:hypothetical protein
MSRARNLANLLDSNGDVVSGALDSQPQLGRRNLIINGAMQVAQRGTSVTGVTSTGYRTCDRWLPHLSSMGTYTISQESSGGPSGFPKSHKMLVTTSASPATSNAARLYYSAEGQDLQGVMKGTADAKPLTLSFWVKSNKTGTGQVNLIDNDNSRNVNKTYTISSANTWEYKTIIFPADTTGALDNDNASSLSVMFFLDGGTNFTTGSVTETWHSGVSANLGAGNTLAIAGAVNNYFEITGVQLEVGSVATPFEHRSYGEELALCQRYYALIANSSSSGEFGFASGFQTSTGGAVVQVQTPVPMRAAPTATASNLGISNQVNFTQAATLAYSGLTNSGGLLGFTYSSAGAQYSPCLLVSQSTLIGNLSFSSEL